MLPEHFHDRATRYVSGDLTEPEREAFEVLLEYDAALRTQVSALQHAAAQLLLLPLAPVAAPRGLKARLLGSLDRVVQDNGPEALVVTTPAGAIEWVNPAFTDLCGYTLAELRGRKPGACLQGPDTDPAAVGRIREAVNRRVPVRETLLNYHKDGTRYRADVRIYPVLDDAGAPVFFVAREQRVTG